MFKKLFPGEAQLSQLRYDIYQLQRENEELKKSLRRLEKANEQLRKDNSDAWNEVHRLKGPRLINDIFSRIIENLRHDRNFLRTCALVCRDWVHLSRPYLFEYIAHYANRGKVDYLTILRNAHCTVFPHVRTIRLRRVSFRLRSENPPSVNAHWMDEFLGHINKFTAVTNIMLTRMCPADLGTLQASLEHIRDQITDIYADGTLFDSMHSFASFLSRFRLLTTLEVATNYNFIPTNFSDRDSPLTEPPPTLRKLRILNDTYGRSTPFDSFVLRWLLDVGYSKIDSVQLWTSCRHPASDVALRQYLCFLGPSLKNMSIAQWGGGNNKGYDTIPISNCTALRYLDGNFSEGWSYAKHTFIDDTRSINSNISYNSDDANFYLPTDWVSFISRLPPSMESITLDMDAPLKGVEYLSGRPIKDDYNWAHVDKLLSGRFPALRKLVIWFLEKDQYRDEALEDHLKELWPQLLPLCAAKRILTVSITKVPGRPMLRFDDM